jgi:hypothetical protein
VVSKLADHWLVAPAASPRAPSKSGELGGAGGATAWGVARLMVSESGSFGNPAGVPYSAPRRGFPPYGRLRHRGQGARWWLTNQTCNSKFLSYDPTCDAPLKSTQPGASWLKAVKAVRAAQAARATWTSLCRCDRRFGGRRRSDRPRARRSGRLVHSERWAWRSVPGALHAAEPGTEPAADRQWEMRSYGMFSPLPGGLPISVSHCAEPRAACTGAIDASAYQGVRFWPGARLRAVLDRDGGHESGR